MEQCAVRSQSVFAAGKNRKRETGENKTDLGHGGKCEGLLQIRGKDCADRAKKHGDTCQEKKSISPNEISEKKADGKGDHPENAGFGQQTGQQGGSWGGRNRMRFGQPEMKRKDPCLCREAQESEGCRDIQNGTVRNGFCVGLKPFEIQGTRKMIQPEEAHQRAHAAEYGNREIGAGGFQG